MSWRPYPSSGSANVWLLPFFANGPFLTYTTFHLATVHLFIRAKRVSNLHLPGPRNIGSHEKKKSLRACLRLNLISVWDHLILDCRSRQTTTEQQNTHTQHTQQTTRAKTAARTAHTAGTHRSHSGQQTDNGRSGRQKWPAESEHGECVPARGVSAECIYCCLVVTVGHHVSNPHLGVRNIGSHEKKIVCVRVFDGT